MTKRICAAFVIMLFLGASASGAIPPSAWNSAGVGILMERTAVRGALGAPSGTDGTLEWYDITGSEGLSRVSLDYLDTGRVQAVSLAFVPGSIDLDTLCSIVKKAFPDTQDVHRDERLAIFLGRSTENNEPVYLLAMADDPDGGKGSELITMTELANLHYQEQKAPQ
ncbi:MAG: hypothetical protein Q7I97_09610 [Thermovirgaceae bacterium]|nr:hypothetical protein [Thermovirgaceae bacterium]